MSAGTYTYGAKDIPARLRVDTTDAAQRLEAKERMEHAQWLRKQVDDLARVRAKHAKMIPLLETILTILKEEQ